MASKSINSFNPLGDAGNASRRPASILLGQEAYVAVSRNDTSATAKSRDGHTVEVTFWIADPPDVSFCTVHCSDSGDAGFEVQPNVVGAKGRFVLLRTRFASSGGEDEYFMYKGDPKSPSLECVPLPDDDILWGGVSDFGIVPRHDGAHYLLATICCSVTMLVCKLHIYSSEDRTWRTKELLNPCPREYTIVPEKVITLREGVLGWVDFWGGMLVCNLLQKLPDVRYIPLPEPLPENAQKLKPRCFRDITCTDGVIKFIEMEHRVIVREIVPEKPSDPSDKDVLYDSDLIMSRKRKDVDSKPKKLRLMNGWRAVTWTRGIESNCWLKGRAVDADDILVDDSAYSALLSGQRDESLGSLTFRELYSAWPTLSTDGDDLLYLFSDLKMGDAHGQLVVAVDLAKKTLKVQALGARSYRMYRSCTLSNHLNMIPGIKVRAFFKIEQAGSTANDPNNTAICVDEPDSCESENKRSRLSAEKVNHAQIGAQDIVQNLHPPQVSFNRWDRPCYPGYSLRPHQNNLPPHKYFNKWDGPCNHGYAPLPPSPNLHGYGNYQSPWRQPACSTFRPHEVPQPYLNNWDEASYYGYSHQLPACNSYAYGSYQLQQQQLPPMQAQQRPPVQHQLTPSGVWTS